MQRFRAMSTELYVHICEKFPWVSITPTVHKLLGHSWELISENDGHGLGNLDESGLEACNKLIWKFRTSLAWKTSQIDNLTDVLRRLWVNTDPIINLERQKTLSFCKLCSARGHSTRYCIAKKDITDDDLIKYLTSRMNLLCFLFYFLKDFLNVFTFLERIFISYIFQNAIWYHMCTYVLF